MVSIWQGAETAAAPTRSGREARAGRTTGAPGSPCGCPDDTTGSRRRGEGEAAPPSSARSAASARFTAMLLTGSARRWKATRSAAESGRWGRRGRQGDAAEPVERPGSNVQGQPRSASGGGVKAVATRASYSRARAAIRPHIGGAEERGGRSGRRCGSAPVLFERSRASGTGPSNWRSRSRRGLDPVGIGARRPPFFSTLAATWRRAGRIGSARSAMSGQGTPRYGLPPAVPRDRAADASSGIGLLSGVDADVVWRWTRPGRGRGKGRGARPLSRGRRPDRGSGQQRPPRTAARRPGRLQHDKTLAAPGRGEPARIDIVLSCTVRRHGRARREVKLRSIGRSGRNVRNCRARGCGSRGPPPRTPHDRRTARSAPPHRQPPTRLEGRQAAARLSSYRLVLSARSSSPTFRKA